MKDLREPLATTSLVPGDMEKWQGEISLCAEELQAKPVSIFVSSLTMSLNIRKQATTPLK